MASVNKFEQLLEYVVNGEQAKAEDLFHALVVAKSREIYENLINEEMEEEEMDEAMEEEDMDESMEEEDMDESMDDDSGYGGDETDDMVDDMKDPEGDEPSDDDESDHMGHDKGSEDDRLNDLEDALNDLKAEFEMLVKGEEHEEEGDPSHHGDVHMSDIEHDMQGGGHDEMGGGMFEEEIEEIAMSPAEMMREYVDKIGEPYKSGNGISNTKEGGHVGAQAGSVTGTTNTKSVVAKKNDMGGTTANIARGGEAGKGGTQGGLLNPTTKEENFRNINVPGGNAGKTGFTHRVSDGHGTEKKGKGETGGTNTKSLFR
jgi:hypothetical protein